MKNDKVRKNRQRSRSKDRERDWEKENNRPNKNNNKQILKETGKGKKDSIKHNGRIFSTKYVEEQSKNLKI